MQIGVVGAGFVGSVISYALTIGGVAEKIILIDVDKERARAEAMDISHALPFCDGGDVVAGEYGDLKDSDVIIITAGDNQKKGETRIDLLDKNVKIFKDIIPKIAQNAPNSILIIDYLNWGKGTSQEELPSIINNMPYDSIYIFLNRASAPFNSLRLNELFDYAVPVVINSEKIKNNVIYKKKCNEIIWAFTRNDEFREKIRNYQFEAILKQVGIKLRVNILSSEEEKSDISYEFDQVYGRGTNNNIWNLNEDRLLLISFKSFNLTLLFSISFWHSITLEGSSVSNISFFSSSSFNSMSLILS